MLTTGLGLCRLAYSIFFGRLNYADIIPNYCILFIAVTFIALKKLYLSILTNFKCLVTMKTQALIAINEQPHQCLLIT